MNQLIAIAMVTGVMGLRLSGVAAARDPGVNQPGAVGNRGVGAPGVGARDPGINQPGAIGNTSSANRGGSVNRVGRR